MNDIIMKNISYELMKPEDYKALIKIWLKSELPYKPLGRDSYENISKQIKESSCDIIFALLKNEIVGAVLVSHDGRKGWINRLAVPPKFRNNNIAIGLIEKAEEWFEGKEIHIYACLIEGFNNKSVHLFKKAGYKVFKGMKYLTKRDFPEI